MSKGKNFSGNNLGQRKESDFYETPYSLTRQFLDATKEEWVFDLPVLEPACGDEAIVKVLDEYKFRTIHYYDLQDGTDFMDEDRQWPYLITNPAFSKAQDFIKKAKEVVMFQFAMLLPLSYLHGKRRYDEIYQDTEFPLSKVFIFTRYPMLGEPLREDGKYHTGMMVYAWYLWNRNHEGAPTIHWIDNDPYVLRKGE